MTGSQVAWNASVAALLANLILAVAVQAAPPGSGPPPGESNGPSGSTNSANSANSALPPTAPPQVEFERLFRLPKSYNAGGGRHRGVTSEGWRTRFAETSSAVASAQRELADAQDALENTAADSSQWQMGAPGLGQSNADHASVSYKLRAQIRGLRDDVAAAEQQQRELVIEADLAGVPDSWRVPEARSRSDRVDPATSPR